MKKILFLSFIIVMFSACKQQKSDVSSYSELKVEDLVVSSSKCHLLGQDEDYATRVVIVEGSDPNICLSTSAIEKHLISTNTQAKSITESTLDYPTSQNLNLINNSEYSIIDIFISSKTSDVAIVTRSSLRFVGAGHYEFKVTNNSVEQTHIYQKKQLSNTSTSSELKVEDLVVSSSKCHLLGQDEDYATRVVIVEGSDPNICLSTSAIEKHLISTNTQAKSITESTLDYPTSQNLNLINNSEYSIIDIFISSKTSVAIITRSSLRFVGAGHYEFKVTNNSIERTYLYNKK